jgi:hypothetical protein
VTANLSLGRIRIAHSDHVVASAGEQLSHQLDHVRIVIHH